jgi:hypothetical protein
MLAFPRTNAMLEGDSELFADALLLPPLLPPLQPDFLPLQGD